MFTLLQEFMPPPAEMRGVLLHSPIENGAFKVNIGTYQPRLLGTTAEEASWRLLHRVHEAIINARAATFPIIQALYAGNPATVVTHQLKAATMDAQVVADALHTIVSLGADKFDPRAEETLRSVSIAAFWPVEAVNLYYPQSHFFGSPYWGHARVGTVLEGGTKAVPLRLRISDKEKEFADGLGTGIGRPLTWLIPKGVYQRFSVLGGLHPQLGAKGRIELTILGDGRPLATAIVGGSDPAQLFDCDITGISQLQLAVAARGSDPKRNYAIWAEPMLLKKRGESP
jgi:hypothetical protein